MIMTEVPKKGIKGGVDVVVAEVKKLVDEGFKRSTLHSLTACPTGVRFESQQEGEKILLFMRRHPVTNLWWMAITTMLVFVPMFWNEFPLVSGLEASKYLALTMIWYLGLLFFVVQNTLLWFYNVYIVTDERLIDVDFFGLLYKNINVTKLNKIEDVNYSQVGFLASMFNYGNVVIQTSSEQRSDDTTEERSAFTFDACSNPDRVTRVISELMDQEELEQYEGRVR